MRYAINGIRGQKPDRPIRVYDAAGDWVANCTFCDTETGEVERTEHAPGSPTPRTVNEYRPWPLKVVLLK